MIDRAQQAQLAAATDELPHALSLLREGRDPTKNPDEAKQAIRRASTQVEHGASMALAYDDLGHTEG